MRGFSRLRCVLFCALSFHLAGVTLAQPPDILRKYRFLPGHSTLHVSGGFPGWDFESPVVGKYGFATGFEHDFDSAGFPVLDPYASFVDVDAYWIHPLILAPSPLDRIDLDQTLNLSGLEGHPVPLPAVIVPPFGNIELFAFHGEDGQGAPFRLHVLRAGRWMFMKGANDPPCCDFFNYRIRALARQIPFADFNDDNTVSAADLGLLQASFGTSSASLATGDADGDGLVGGGDFFAWQRSYGETAPTMDFDALLDSLVVTAATSSSAARAVPEPGTVSMTILLLCACCTAKRRGSRRQ